jgi:hypothetical protein
LVVFHLANIDTMEKMSPRYPIVISWIHVMIESVNNDKGEKKDKAMFGTQEVKT